MAVQTPTLSTQDEKARTTPRPAPGRVSQPIRARASLMATVALEVAVAAVLTVATGVLAALGAALGLLASLIAIGGITASRQRDVAGTGTSVLGLLLGLAALAVGVLAVTGSLGWLDPTVNNVTRLHEWLAAVAPWATPKA